MTRFRSPACLWLVLCLVWPAAAADDSLRQYVQAPDDSFRYVVRHELAIGQTEAIELLITSQTWRGIPWKHQAYLIKPAQVTAPRHAVLMITGGRWNDRYEQSDKVEWPEEAQLFVGLAERLGSVVMVVRQVPFQPIFDNLREDAAIAYTFDQYLDSGEGDWPLLLPMTKAAVRAMDTAQAVAAERWGVGIERFTVTGASKRGWTTWLSGATDPRVGAIVPMVIDMLNLDSQMHHQLATWGAFSAMIHDYEERGILARLKEPRGQQLISVVDPYAYRDRLTMPKLVVLGTNDPYWPVDALNLYWDGLAGEKRILYVPNAGHGLEAGIMNVLAGLVAVHRAAAGMLTLPVIDWTIEERADGLVFHVTSDRQPTLVQAWSASSPTRDFRHSAWAARSLTAQGDGYDYLLPRPAAGFGGAYVDLLYQDGDQAYNLTTQLRLIEAAAVTQR